MYITGLGTAAPAKRFSQVQCWEAVQRSEFYRVLSTKARAILRGVLLNDNGIDARHLALDALEDAFQLAPDPLQERFATHAPELVRRAATAALRDAALEAGDIDAILISTCTGYLCPGLSSYAIESLGLRPDVVALDFVGQGCGAALPNLRAAEALVESGRCETALSVCVEVCSAAFYMDEDPGVLISACLFGDGAGAAVVAAAPPPHRRRVEWGDAYSFCDPAQREALRFTHCAGMLRNVLSPEVPALAGRYAAAVLGNALERKGLQHSDIQSWILHAGGKKVLQRLRENLRLDESATRHSAEILAQFGNLSSPFVYFVLERALAENAPGGWWWMSSFGAGFSCHGALLKVA